VSDEPRMPSRSNSGGRNPSGERKSSIPSWYAKQEDAAKLKQAANAQRNAPISSKDTDRLWRARSTGAQGRGYYDESYMHSGQIAGRSAQEGYRAPREDLERGDWYHQQMTHVRSAMPDAPQTSQYRTQVLPNIPGNIPRRSVEVGPDARRMQANRQRAQARARGRRKKNLFAENKHRQKKQTIIVVCIVVLLVILFVVILTLTGLLGSAPSA
jgi:hypothetical protein